MRLPLIRPPATFSPRAGRRCSREWVSALPDDPQPNLHLTRITRAAAYCTVEIENQVRDCWPDEVLAVEHVEHIQSRLDRCRTERKGTRETEIQRGVLIVLATKIALRDRAVGI